MDEQRDRRRRSDGRIARVLHVPLTEDEYQQLRRMSFDSGATMGDLASAGTRYVLRKNLAIRDIQGMVAS